MARRGRRRCRRRHGRCDWNLGYGFLGRLNKIRGHGKTEGLTVSRLEGNAASGKAPKLVVDGGRELEREKAHG